MQSFIRQVRTVLRRLQGPAHGQQLLFRAVEADRVEDPWMKRILQLADGRLATEVVETLYLEALQSGAWVTDIGMWRGLFYQEMAEKLRELAQLEYLTVIDQSFPERQYQGSRTGPL